MKKLLIAGCVVTAALLTGCENYKDELSQMTVSRDSLIAVTNSKDKAIDEFVTSFDEIESNLAEITARQQAVQEKTGNRTEMTVATKERIKTEIEAIKQLMEDSKARTAELSRKLKNSNFRVAKFEKMVASLNEQIAAKDSQLVTLNDQVASLNTQVTTLNAEVATLNVKDSVNTDIITKQTTKINTAYIAMGDYKKLRDQQVVTKEGGFLGLGKEEKLSPQLNTEAFRPVDITQLTSIPVNTKDVKLVTVHPNGSYEIAKQNDKVSEIKITDYEKFWSTSKYLVVMTEE
jgi:seryl-tRNA synthetase